MIDTYEIERQMEDTLTEALSVNELKQRYADMATTAALLSAQKQSLEQSMFELISESEIEAIGQRSDEMLMEYAFRNTPKETQDVLFEYGYTKPVVLVEPTDIDFCLDESIPMLLLFPDNTERLAKDGVEIKRHIEENGFVGMSQYSYEKMEYIKEFGREEW